MIGGRKDFPLLAANPDLHYLDSAATSQKPRAVLDAMLEYYTRDNANPHRGAYALSARATERYHDARIRVARFIGVKDADRVIFTRGTTESLNLVAAAWGRANVRAGDEIVVTGLEHHANFVPWQQLAIERGAMLRIAQITSDGRIDVDHFASLVGPRTKVVDVSARLERAGHDQRRRAVEPRSRGRSARSWCATARKPRRTFRLAIDQLDVDFYAFSGHKMLGPMGCGVLVGRRELLEAMPPYQTGGDMIEYVGDERTTWNVLPHKFEAGTPNVGDAVGLGGGMRLSSPRSAWTGIREHERALTALATSQLSNDARRSNLRTVARAAERRGELHRRRDPSPRPGDDSRRGRRLHSRGTSLRPTAHAPTRRPGDGARVVLRLQRRGGRRRARRGRRASSRGVRRGRRERRAYLIVRSHVSRTLTGTVVRDVPFENTSMLVVSTHCSTLFTRLDPLGMVPVTYARYPSAPLV